MVQVRMMSLSLVRHLHDVAMDAVSTISAEKIMTVCPCQSSPASPDVLDATVWQGDAVLPHHVAVLVPLPVLAVVLQTGQADQNN